MHCVKGPYAMSTVAMRPYIGLHGVAQSDATYAAAATFSRIGVWGTVSYGTQRRAPTEQRRAAANHAE